MKLREEVSWLMGTMQRNLIASLEECCERPLTEKERQLEPLPYEKRLIGVPWVVVTYPFCVIFFSHFKEVGLCNDLLGRCVNLGLEIPGI